MITDRPPPPASQPLLRRVLVGLSAGIAVGLFLGEQARVLEAAADSFVKLLQMAVLPYVTVSIIGSIGALRVEDLRALGARVGVVLAGLWALALACAFLIPLTFPPRRGAAFFSTTMLDAPAAFNLVDLYIPANPFFALANNIVPAVVLFSIVVGVALIGVPRKQILLDVLGAASDTLARAMRFVVRLTPYGAFAIAATTAGTLRLEEAGRLEIYLLAYGALALLLGLWVLPGLVSALTPIPARAIFAATREALLTAVVAGDLFIVLPVLIAACKGLLVQYGPADHHAEALPDVIVPVSYNFPHSGKLLSVSFVLFAGWFSDAAIEPASYPRLALAALVSLFGSVTTAMPFLLDLFRVPADTFQLFIASGVINSRFGTLVAAMHTVTMALLGTCAVTGMLRWRMAAVTRYAVVTVALTIAVVGGTRALGTLLARPDAGGDVLAAMHVETRASATVFRGSSGAAAGDASSSSDRLGGIEQRRVLRVGYLADALPFAFFNGRQELVGFDVALMHRLAIELGARLVFVPIEHGALDRSPGAAALLDEGYCDIVIGGIAMTTTRAGLMQLSIPYLDETLALIVPDDTRRRFESWDAIRARGALTIAVPDVPYYVDKLRARLPQARLLPVPTVDDLFVHGAGADAFALPAERGSVWTLRYPQYSVVVPLPQPIKVPLAYATPRGEPALTAFVNTWLELKRRDGTVDQLYQYWILGRDAAAVPPRWSIIRDVLHWVE
jgi:Na+/H+-dicarboxylate symporter/ABC-type amino acid transport substrate-binding protein